MHARNCRRKVAPSRPSVKAAYQARSGYAGRLNETQTLPEVSSDGTDVVAATQDKA
jgi:hypothetical protein